MKKNNTYTLGKLRTFLCSLTKEQMEQPVHIAFEDCPVQDLDGHEIQKEDIYVNKHDHDDVGTLKELRKIHKGEEDFDEEDYKIATPKGTIIFY